MKKPIIFIFLAMFLIFPFSFFGMNVSLVAAKNTASESLEKPKITARSALLLDYTSGTVLFSKNEDERLPVASMTKLASLSVILDAIEKGAVKENDTIKVSSNAASVGGSSAFLVI